MMPKPSTMRQARYDAKHVTRYSLKLNNTTDADVIARLASVGNVQGYIKSLIRADLDR